VKDYKLILDEILRLNHEAEYLVEFSGIPGSGKSYISKKLDIDLTNFITRSNRSVNLTFHTIDIYSNSLFKRIIYKSFIISLLLFKNFKVIFTVLSIINLFDGLSIRNRLKLIFNWLYICAFLKKEKKIKNKSSKKILIMDQSLSQALWSCYFYNENVKPNEEKLLRLFNNLRNKLCLFEHTVITVKADIDKVISRLSHRQIAGSSPLNSLNRELINKGIVSQQYVEAFLKRSQKDSSLPALVMKEIKNNKEL
jgi:hypothetical protein